ncbi:MAG TPA: helix-turn-helix domain-containing protein [Nitrososphaerales archaeon]|nr:helix-turn-helix domain-containing protein [Nitrososphaerales archaeon]
MRIGNLCERAGLPRSTVSEYTALLSQVGLVSAS